MSCVNLYNLQKLELFNNFLRSAQIFSSFNSTLFSNVPFSKVKVSQTKQQYGVGFDYLRDLLYFKVFFSWQTTFKIKLKQQRVKRSILYFITIYFTTGKKRLENLFSFIKRLYLKSIAKQTQFSCACLQHQLFINFQNIGELELFKSIFLDFTTWNFQLIFVFYSLNNMLFNFFFFNF